MDEGLAELAGPEVSLATSPVSPNLVGPRKLGRDMVVQPERRPPREEIYSSET